VRVMLLIVMLETSSFLFSQTVCVGTDQHCAEAQKEKCASEPVPENFLLTKSNAVQGNVSDRTGANVQDVEVQLRSPRTGKVLQSVAVVDGVFDLGEVKSGSYRLIFVKRGNHTTERLRMWDQPHSLVCADSASTCSLSVVLTLHGTDDTMDFCPPR
jgi:hypothetical protein